MDHSQAKMIPLSNIESGSDLLLLGLLYERAHSRVL